MQVVFFFFFYQLSVMPYLNFDVYSIAFVMYLLYGVLFSISVLIKNISKMVALLFLTLSTRLILIE